MYEFSKGSGKTESRNWEASSKKEDTAGKLSQGAATKGSRRQHEQLRVSPKSMGNDWRVLAVETGDSGLCAPLPVCGTDSRKQGR